MLLNLVFILLVEFLSEGKSVLPRGSIAILGSCLFELQAIPNYTNVSFLVPVASAIDWDVNRPGSLLAFNGSYEFTFDGLGPQLVFMCMVKICHFQALFDCPDSVWR